MFLTHFLINDINLNSNKGHTFCENMAKLLQQKKDLYKVKKEKDKKKEEMMDND